VTARAAVETRLCACGCGREAKPGRFFLPGHNAKKGAPKLSSRERRKAELDSRRNYEFHHRKSPWRDRTPAPVPGPQPGNLHALGHGAYSSQIVIPKADEFAAWVLETYSHLRLEDGPAVRNYAVVQVQAWLVAGWVEEHGVFDSKHRIRPAVELMRKLTLAASTLAGKLGLDPTSRAALDVDRAQTARIAFDLAREDLREGRRLVEAAERRELEAGADSGRG